MKVRIAPSPLQGEIQAIASKSAAHRLLICAALADAPTRIVLTNSSLDIEATADCLRALGAVITPGTDHWQVSPIHCSPRPANEVVRLDCRESGSTLRFLLPLATALYAQTAFTGAGRLPERPLVALTQAMQQHGVGFSAEKLPFTTQGRLQAGTYVLPGNISSQYISGLLMALPFLPGESRIVLSSAAESAAYIDMTLAALACFAVHSEKNADGFTLSGGQRYRAPRQVEVEGDWSNAAFFLVAGALGAAALTVHGLSLDSAQGDKAIVDFLQGFGATVVVDAHTGSVTVSPGKLRGCPIDIGETPDLMPILAVLAACAEGETHFSNAARLRLKESDRIHASAQLINSLGGCAEALDDGLIVRGTALQGGTVCGYNDHRIVMAAAIAAGRCTADVQVTDADAVNKSYPGFYADFSALGGHVHVI